jgi:opine dehydrogenase
MAMPEKTNYTVIGAGQGGKAMAAHLALLDFPVTLYNRTPENVAVIKKRLDVVRCLGQENPPESHH